MSTRGSEPAVTRARYLRLTIDIRVANNEFADALLNEDPPISDLQQNIEAGEIEIDGYYDVEDHS